MTTCKHCGLSDSTLRWQSERIEELETKVAGLQRSLRRVQTVGPTKAQIGEQRLTTCEGAMLALLLTQPSVSNDALFHCIERRAGEALGRNNVVKVQIHRMRQRLKPLGLRIDTIYGYGYSMPREDRERGAARFVA